MQSLIERGDCPMRHENGNCTAAGGFCTAVNDPICEALHNAFYCGEQSKIEWATMVIAEQTTKYAQKTLEALQKIHEKVTAEAEPVKHGRWKFVGYTLKGEKTYECTECNFAVANIDKVYMKHCPNCIAKMDKEE